MVRLSLRQKQAPEARRRPAAPTSRPRAYSYYASIHEEKRPQAVEDSIDLNTFGRRLRLLPSIIALLVIVGSLLFSLTISTSPSVSLLKDDAALYRGTDEYGAAVQELLGQRLANQTKLTVDTAAVERALMERFPELDAVVLRLPVLGRRPSLILSVSKPVMLLVAPTKTWVLNQSGVAVSEANRLAAEAKQGLPVVRDQSGLDITLGKQALTTETIRFILAAVAQLNTQKLAVSELTLPTHVSELDIRLQGERYFIKTDTSGDARLQIGSFLAVRDELKSGGVVPAEYVDVRVEEKVFYK